MNRPVDKSTQDHEGSVAAAIRRKHGEKTSIATDLEAMEAALIAELERFDLCMANPLPEPVDVEADLRQLFPEILPDGVVRVVPAAPAGAPAAVTVTAAEEAGACDLLQQLRQQAEIRRQDEALRQEELSTINRDLDQALRRVFKYCYELVQQLNILKPTVTQHYSLPGSVEFSGLQWQEGFVDYRTRTVSTGTVYEQVSLSCRLAAPAKLSIERDAISADNFRKNLFDNGVTFTCDEIRNARQMVEKVVFSLNAEVKINVRWLSAPERGGMAFESRNLERFGTRNHLLQPKAVDSAMLDHFARLLLGQPNRFRDYYSR